MTKKLHPFEDGRRRYLTGRLEFYAFLQTWRPIYEIFASSNERFDRLDRIYGHWESDEHPEEHVEYWRKKNRSVPAPPFLQISFGRRFYGLGRLTLDAHLAKENGPRIVYSLSAMGSVAVILYPAGGDLAHVEESAMVLRQGFFTAHQLRRFLVKDLRTLVDYGYVTAFDATPTWSQRFHIWRLRKLRHRIGRGENAPPIPGVGVGALVKLTAGAIAKAALVAAFKPVGVAMALVLIFALTKSGFFEWIGLPSIPAAMDLTR